MGYKTAKKIAATFFDDHQISLWALTGFEARYNRMLVTYETLVSHIEMNSSVTKAIDLLEGSARSKKPAALNDLARNTGLNKATAYRLYSLCQPGLVHKSADAMLSQAETLAIIKTRRAGKFTRPVF